MSTTIDAKQIVTKSSGHVAPGPPGISPSVPTPPAGPVPTPFAYVAKSADAKSGTTDGTSLNVSGKVLLEGAIMKMVPPVNKPALPVGMGDIVTKAFEMWGVAMEGASDTRAEGKKIACTLHGVRLNVMNAQMQIAQVQTKFIGGADFDMIVASGQAQAWYDANCSLCADPVSITTGEVIDWDFDLSLPGRFPLVLQRHYCSSFRREKTTFGRGGWRHAFHQWIDLEGGRPTLHTPTGRHLALPVSAPRDTGFRRDARIDVTWESADTFRVRDAATRLTRVFSRTSRTGKHWLREIRDAYGSRIELAYDGERLVEIVDTARRRVALRHDGKGRIVAAEVIVEDAVLLQVAYGYTDEGELGTVTNAAGHVTRYTYDGKHRLTSKSLADGPTFRYEYDADSGQCVRAGSDEGFHPAGLDYDPPRRTVAIHSTPAPRIVEYDEKLSVVRDATPDGAKATTFTRDDDGYALTETNAAGETVTFEYDERGNRVSRTDAAGLVTKWKIEGDLPVEQIDPDGATTTWTHDGRGEVLTTTAPSGVTVTAERDGWGRITALSGPDGRLFTHAYDDAHNLVRTTDARGAVTSYTFDPLGRLVGRADPSGTSVRIENDPLGRPVLFTYSDGTKEAYAWDAQNRVTSITNRRGETTTIEWVGMSSPRRVVTPDGRTWRFEVDVLERLTGVESPRAEAYEIRYDRAGRVRDEVTFDGSAFSYQYDRSGRLARVELPGDAWLAYAYDPSGNVVEEDSPHGKRTFAWNEGSRVVEGVMHDYDRAIGVAFERDAAGRAIAEAQGSRVVRREYDRSGRLAARILPDGQTTRYYYDAAGDLSAIDHEGHKIALQRDKLGREVRRHVYRGAIDILWSFDAGGRQVEQWAVARPDPSRPPSPLLRRRWTYDAETRPVEVMDGRWGRAAYAYSPTDQLLGVEGRFGVRYDHDPSGALVGAAGYTDEVIAPWKVRAGNVLLRTATHEYSYDHARRRRKSTPLRGGKPTEYKWDARSRLREVHLPSGERVCFWYDAFGRRTLKLVVPKPLPMEDFGKEPPKQRSVEYIWDGLALAAELDSERGVRVFVHHPTTLAPILQIERGRAFTYVVDAVGMPRELIDDRGKIAWAGALSPYGEVRETYKDPDAEPAAPPFRQLGHYADDETGLLCTLHRYFDPAVGRWLSIDPLLLDSGNNAFGMSRSPTIVVDPFGLGEFDVQPYRQPNPGFERHEPLQNTWIEGRGIGSRGAGRFSRGNPTVGLTDAMHDDVHRIADAMFRATGKSIHELSAEEVIAIQAAAMKQAGVPQDKIDEVCAQARQHAPKFVCT